MPNLTQIGCFRTVTPVGYEMMHKAWSTIEEVPYCFSSSSVKFQGHMALKSAEFDPIGRFGLYLQFNFIDGYEMIHKALSNIEEVPYYFEGHPSNFNVTQLKKLSILTQIRCFQTVTLVWIHIWWWNDAYSLMMLRRGALLFFKVIPQISRSHGSKKRQIWPRLGVSGL